MTECVFIHHVISAVFDFTISVFRLFSVTCKLQFEEALSEPDPKEGLRKLIDPRLGEDYPIDSVLKVRIYKQLEAPNQLMTDKERLLLLN